MSKLIIIMVAALLVFVEQMVQGQGVVTVSDPGQYPSGRFIITGYTADFIYIDLTTSDTSNQTVYLTIEQNGAASDMDLAAIFISADNSSYHSSFSNKLTGMQAVLGPFVVQPGQTNSIIITAKINSLKATNSSPVIVGLDLTAVSNSTPGVIEGVLPIHGTTYVISAVDTNSIEMIEGKLKFESLTYNDNENGIYYLLTVTAKADPLRTYTLEHSLDMVSWDEWLAGIQPAGRTGNFQVSAFLDPTNFPNMGFFRLKSQKRFNPRIKI